MTNQTATAEYALVDVDHVHPHPRNVRREVTGVDELAASIKNLFARLAPPSGEAVSAPASAWAVAEPNAPYPHRTGARTPTAGKPVGRRGAAGARCIGVKRAPGPATPNRFPPGGPVIRSFSHGRLAVDLSLAAAVNGLASATATWFGNGLAPLRNQDLLPPALWAAVTIFLHRSQAHRALSVGVGPRQRAHDRIQVHPGRLVADAPGRHEIGDARIDQAARPLQHLAF